MSSIAVFLVLGGATAFAAEKIGSNQLRGGLVTTAKLKKNAVTAGKIKAGAVTTAHSANVSAAGTVLAGSLGIAQANVAHTSAGFYCFSGLNPAPVGGVATVDYSEAGKDVTIQLDTGPPPGILCPAGTQAFVDPREKLGEPVDAGFFVLLY